MRHLYLYAVITAALGFQFQNDPQSEPQVSTNLLVNGSFEEGNSPTLRGWTAGNPDLARLANEAPPKGGNWSLELTADWSPTSGYVRTFVNDITPGEVFRLSAYVRAVGPGGGGVIELRMGSSAPRSASTRDTLWTELSVMDTVHAGGPNTVWVTLSSLHTEILQRKGLFDLVKLERVGQ